MYWWSTNVNIEGRNCLEDFMEELLINFLITCSSFRNNIEIVQYWDTYLIAMIRGLKHAVRQMCSYATRLSQKTQKIFFYDKMNTAIWCLITNQWKKAHMKSVIRPLLTYSINKPYFEGSDLFIFLMWPSNIFEFEAHEYGCLFKICDVIYEQSLFD